VLGYDWKTYPERLQQAGVSWIVYQNMPDNFGDNPLAGFRLYRRANEASGKPVSNEAQPPSPAYDPASDDAGNPLYRGIANTMPYSEHPGPSSPVQGAWYIQETLDALTAVPEVWSRTVLLVNFDENDGYFDHVPSPSAPSLNPDGTMAGKTTLRESDLSFERFIHPSPPGTTGQPQPDGRVYGPGVRVPLYVLSPWSRGGWVNSQVFDHTSIVRFLEKRFGFREPNISRYRRAVGGDLTSAFNFVRPNNEVLPTLRGRKTLMQADALRAAQEQLPAITPPANAMLPVQATGTRPSRALPYELDVSARSHIRRGKLELVFANTGDAAAVFHVYDKLHLERLPRRYMVEPNKRLDDDWDAMADNGGRYDLWVLGPNGFHRHTSRATSTACAAATQPIPRSAWTTVDGAATSS
jgi:phospholipase C